MLAKINPISLGQGQGPKARRVSGLVKFWPTCPSNLHNLFQGFQGPVSLKIIRYHKDIIRIILGHLGSSWVMGQVVKKSWLVSFYLPGHRRDQRRIAVWKMGLPGWSFLGAEQIYRWYGYGSIPINTIFRGMNIHLPAILMFTRGTRFW
jgi:hypothetical protein